MLGKLYFILILIIKAGLGPGTNNQPEFLALKILLQIALDQNTNHLQVYGDFAIVIHQINSTNGLHNVQLWPVGDLLKLVCSSFDFIAFIHIYRELDQEADYLSKEGQQLAEGVLVLDEFQKGILTHIHFGLTYHIQSFCPFCFYAPYLM